MSNKHSYFIATMFFLYFIGMFLTYGWVYTRYTCPYTDDREKASCEREVLTDARINGLLWPLYWGGYFGYKLNSLISKPARSY